MPDVIQCPTCSKRFRLPEKPPATFACTGCGTTMDLSGFRQEAPAAAAAPRASVAATSDRPRRSSRTDAGPDRPRRAGSASRRRRDDDDDGGDRFAPPKKESKALLWVSLGGFVFAVVIAVVVLGRGDKKPPAPETPPATAEGGGVPAPGAAPATAAAPRGATPPGSAPATEPGAASTGATPPAGEPKPPEKKDFVSLAKETFHPIDHHPDATPDERERIDKLVDLAVFQNAGRDSRDAERELVQIGMHAAPRVVNVFSTVKMGEGFEVPSGRIKAAVADRILRGIDGFLDRKNHGHLMLLKVQHAPKVVENIAKQWVWWWDNEYWKHPQPVWDEAKEGNRGEKVDPEEKPAAPAAMSAE